MPRKIEIEISDAAVIGVTHRAAMLADKQNDPDYEPTDEEFAAAAANVVEDGVGSIGCGWCGAPLPGYPPEDIDGEVECGEGWKAGFELEIDYPGAAYLTAVTKDEALIEANGGDNSLTCTMIDYCPQCGRKIAGW